jgi:hypothetical protein
MSDATEAAVRALVEAARIHPTDKEVTVLARLYPGLRREIEALYSVPTDDDAPVTIRQAEPGS